MIGIEVLIIKAALDYILIRQLAIGKLSAFV